MIDSEIDAKYANKYGRKGVYITLGLTDLAAATLFTICGIFDGPWVIWGVIVSVLMNLPNGALALLILVDSDHLFLLSYQLLYN